MQPSSTTSSSLPLLFIDKLYSILQTPSYSHLITWSQDGTFFTITLQQQFSESVLPQHFKHKKIQSFVRQVSGLVTQLNIYGFKKVRKEILRDSFKHPAFVRGQQGLLKNIRRRVRARKVWEEIEDEEKMKQMMIEGKGSLGCVKTASEGSSGSIQPQQEQEQRNLSVDGILEMEGERIENELLFTHRSITEWDVPFGYRMY